VKKNQLVALASVGFGVPENKIVAQRSSTVLHQT